jgi:class 3 adenylate cyclase
VFDKFTGDGVLVHFLDDESRAIVGRPACDAALTAALAMQRAITRHLVRLRGFLRSNSKLLGGGIGIDTGEAHWSLDYASQPIVVGKGVVYSCRLGDGARSGAIRLTNSRIRA